MHPLQPCLSIIYNNNNNNKIRMDIDSTDPPRIETSSLHHQPMSTTLTAKPHAFAGAVLTPKHARELTPTLVLAVTVSLAEQASSTNRDRRGSAVRGGGGSGQSVDGRSGGIPPAPPPSLPSSPPSLGRGPGGTGTGTGSGSGDMTTLQPAPSTDSGFYGSGIHGGIAGGGPANVALSPSAIAARFCKLCVCLYERISLWLLLQ